MVRRACQICVFVHSVTSLSFNVEFIFRFAYRVFSATIVITFLSAAGLDLYFGFCKTDLTGIVISRHRKENGSRFRDPKSGSSIYIRDSVLREPSIYTPTEGTRFIPSAEKFLREGIVLPRGVFDLCVLPFAPDAVPAPFSAASHRSRMGLRSWRYRIIIRPVVRLSMNMIPHITR